MPPPILSDLAFTPPPPYHSPPCMDFPANNATEWVSSYIPFVTRVYRSAVDLDRRWLSFPGPQPSYSDGTTNLLLQHTVLWKVAGKLIMPKPKGSTSEIKKAPSSGLKWSFSPGTNLLSGGAAKLEKESRQKPNEFSKELRTFRSVDLSGHNFGDDDIFFLAESLGYNQAAEEVDFSGNGITVVGLKTLDGVLQTNTILKTLNLSGNNIGDEGAKEGPVTGRAADVIAAANTTAEVALRLVRPGKKFTNLKYSRVEIDEVRFEWAECMLDYI
ncbi:hypothetical protein ZIOFF_064907 [Zingiber officinale]|uniref:Uncharacterized protein n=1 Tax=Zingiber officinale TaxID=94328 RepID=A0A8J5EZT7_ZINOF|nr:hypothetical protein ZIOFF_064907 [Zingiber officinale]